MAEKTLQAVGFALKGPVVKIKAEVEKRQQFAQRRGTNQSKQGSGTKSQEEGVNILKMKTDLHPSETKSTLEFILNTLCKSMNLKPRHAAALLTDNNQNLLNMCIKGVKSDYSCVLMWYTDINRHFQHLSNILQYEMKSAIDS
mmetsp:Transcript_9412/g.14391  ORF Transcript_9412/g.14391 Transcript_9412/m.14391 type:complete len:143 (+) Transcript_9412:633-1061(+)